MLALFHLISSWNKFEIFQARALQLVLSELNKLLYDVFIMITTSLV